MFRKTPELLFKRWTRRGGCSVVSLAFRCSRLGRATKCRLWRHFDGGQKQSTPVFCAMSRKVRESQVAEINPELFTTASLIAQWRLEAKPHIAPPPFSNKLWEFCACFVQEQVAMCAAIAAVERIVTLHRKSTAIPGSLWWSFHSSVFRLRLVWRAG